MTTHSQAWPAGTPCWVDIMVTDLGRSQAFYAEVLGWQFTDSTEEYGGYTNALVDGQQVAGISPTMEGMESAPHVWSVYLATDDLDATAAAAGTAGAQTLYPPMQLGPLGSMAMFVDPTGASFGSWQSGQHTGYTITEVPGAVAWCDLMTSDAAAAQSFYAALFGYAYQQIGEGGTSYALFTPPGAERPAGGIGELGAEAGGPPAWSVTFLTDDVDTATERVTAAGGTVVTAPHDFEFGRLAWVGGPDGETFGLMTGPASS